MRDLTSHVAKAFSSILWASFFSLPILIPHWHAKLLIVLISLWGIIQIKTRASSWEKPQPLIVAALSVVFILLFGVSLIYSTNLTYGLSSIESIAPLIAIPILLSSRLQIGDRVIRDVLLGFTAGVIVLNLASLMFISYDLWDPKNLQANIILANNHIVKIHPTFLSLYISFSIFFLADRYFPLKAIERRKLGWVLFSIVVLVVYLVWINSRAGIFSFFIAAIFFVSLRYRGQPRLVGFAVLTVLILLIVIIPFSRQRFIDAPVSVVRDVMHTRPSTDPNIFPLETRKLILETSVDILKWPELLYGFGTGDGRDELHKAFINKGYLALANADMDSHNEYLAELHRHGIVGLGIFLALLLSVFIYAVRNKSALLGSFLLLFAVTALFENVFSAQKGATFFALFCPILILYVRAYSTSSTSTSQV